MEGESGAPDRWLRLGRLLGGLLCLAVVLRFAVASWAQLTFPFDLIFETPNLGTIQTLAAGGNPYGVYAEAPFQVTPYTPLYHLVVAALPSSAGNPFFVGRLISLVAMVAAAGALVGVAGRRRWGVALLGVAIFLSLPAANSNAAFVKNDPLALCLSAWAVVAVSRADRGRRMHWVAAALALLAVAAKQNYGAAFLACLVHLGLTDRRRALEFLGIWLGGLVALGLLAHAAWGNGFWFSTLVVPSNPMRWGQIVEIVGEHYLAIPLFAGLALTTVGAAVAWFRSAAAPASVSPCLLYAGCAALSLLATVGKEGASTNYLFEITLAQAMWLVARSGELTAAGSSERAVRVYAPALLCVGIAWGLAVTPAASVSFVDRGFETRRAQAKQVWDATVAEAQLAHPRVIHLHTHLFTLELGGDAIELNDPGLYRLLWRTGKLDPEPLVEALRERRFDLVVTAVDLPGTLSEDAPTRAVETQLLASYAFWWRSPYGDCYRPKPPEGSGGSPR